MFNQVIWWGCIALEGLLVARLAQNKLPKKFPIFYSYLGCVLSVDLLAIPIYRSLPSFYISFYWSAEFLTAILGYGVITEIYNRSLKSYPGAARFFRILLLTVVFLIAAKACASLLGSSSQSLAETTADLERDLRMVQAALAVSLLGLFSYYQIPIGRNLRGLFFGYALFISTNVIYLTFTSIPGAKFAFLMEKLQPITYLLVLVIWSVTLWSSRPEPVPTVTSELEQDYERLAVHTKTMLVRARAHLARAAHP